MILLKDTPLFLELRKENNLTQDELLKITSGSKRKLWWVCDKTHEWEASVGSRRFHGCPYCANKKPLEGFNDLASFSSLLAQEWNYERNSLKPTEVVFGSNKKVWWLGKCGHEWETQVVKRTSEKTNCPYCSGQKLLTGFNDLATMHPELALQWSKKNDIPADEIFYRSKTKAWWNCDKGHEWEAVLANRSFLKRGCPYCANQKILSGYNDLEHIHPELLGEWHPTKNLFKPSEITKGTDMQTWWVCVEGHEWKTSLHHRTGKKKTGCPKCAKIISNAEQEIAYFLKENNLNVVQSAKRILKDGRSELDIYLPELNIAIEFNGLYWHTEKQGKHSSYHYNKWKACKDKGIQLIQIWEDDWIRNPELVKRMLAHKLGFSITARVQARNTAVKLLTQNDTNIFLDYNHIQGAVDGSVRVGLFENIISPSADTFQNPVAVMVLKRETSTEGKTLNLLRYATSMNVVGGFTKLLKHVEREFQPKNIITFSDNTISDGGLYENNGFINIKELKPDYMYVVKHKRVHKFSYRLKRFREDPALKYEEGLSENELAVLNNIPRIWDAGKIKWEKTCVF